MCSIGLYWSLIHDQCFSNFSFGVIRPPLGVWIAAIEAFVLINELLCGENILFFFSPNPVPPNRNYLDYESIFLVLLLFFMVL